MDTATVDERYLKITKRFARLAGVWPDQKMSAKYVSWMITYGFTVPIIFFQIARLIHYNDRNILIEQSTMMSPCFLLLLKESNYILNSAKLRSLLRGIYNDWSRNRPKEECAIMTVYAERGAFLATFYLVNAYICAFLFLQVPWTARLLNTFHVTNTTELFYVMPAYYFVDEYKYYYWMNAHGSMVVILVVVVYVAADTGYTVLVQHACGLLAVAGYRFKYAICSDACSSGEDTHLAMMEAYRKVRLSIRAHEHAISYLREIEGAHMVYLFFCMGLNVLCFSITLVKVVTMEPCVETYKYISFLVVQLMHLFYLTVQGQFVIDVTDEIYNKTYEALWYKGNQRTQALYVLALRRNLTPPRLTAGGLIQLNMQSFSEIVKLSVSYYTVLRTT